MAIEFDKNPCVDIINIWMEKIYPWYRGVVLEIDSWGSEDPRLDNASYWVIFKTQSGKIFHVSLKRSGIAGGDYEVGQIEPTQSNFQNGYDRNSPAAQWIEGVLRNKKRNDAGELL